MVTKLSRNNDLSPSAEATLPSARLYPCWSLRCLHADVTERMRLDVPSMGRRALRSVWSESREPREPCIKLWVQTRYFLSTCRVQQVSGVFYDRIWFLSKSATYSLTRPYTRRQYKMDHHVWLIVHFCRKCRSSSGAAREINCTEIIYLWKYVCIDRKKMFFVQQFPVAHLQCISSNRALHPSF